MKIALSVSLFVIIVFSYFYSMYWCFQLMDIANTILNIIGLLLMVFLTTLFILFIIKKTKNSYEKGTLRSIIDGISLFMHKD
jgi:hypothetical protein